MDIEARIRNIISAQLEISPERVIPSAVLSDLNGDSLSQVELVLAVEEEFCTDISDDEAMKIKTVGDLVEFVSNSLGVHRLALGITDASGTWLSLEIKSEGPCALQDQERIQSIVRDALLSAGYRIGY